MIDWSRVNELRDEVGEEDFDEVVTLFLDEVAEVIARLRAATDGDSLEADLHFLKGCTMNLGFAHVSDLCHAGERMAASGRAAEVDVPAIVAGFETSQAVFQSDLGARVA